MFRSTYQEDEEEKKSIIKFFDLSWKYKYDNIVKKYNLNK